MRITLAIVALTLAGCRSGPYGLAPAGTESITEFHSPIYTVKRHHIPVANMVDEFSADGSSRRVVTMPGELQPEEFGQRSSPMERSSDGRSSKERCGFCGRYMSKSGSTLRCTGPDHTTTTTTRPF